jgi:hypothetical protein
MSDSSNFFGSSMFRLTKDYLEELRLHGDK